MTDRRGFVALLAVLALTAGLLTWGVVGRSEERCLWAVTIGTDQSGYLEVPCGLTPRETFEYLKENPELLSEAGLSPANGGVWGFLGHACKPGQRPAPGDDPADC